MKLLRTGVLAAVTAAALFASCGSAFAMQPATPKTGLAAGVSVGYDFGKFPGAFGATGDIEYGLTSNLLKSHPVTAIVLDDLGVFGSGYKINLATLGVLQPVADFSQGTVGVEAGFARTYTYVRGFGNATNSGGMIGGRATFLQATDMAINVMTRYYFGGDLGSFWQIGAGVTKDMSGTKVSLDYYRIHPTGAGAVDDNFIGVGARFNLGS